jgi:hypothetical protein
MAAIKKVKKVKAPAHDAGVTVKERSPLWPKVEKKHKKLFPTCAACGTNEEVQVHHKRPFHLHPELELDPNNLISLCMVAPKNCHLTVGHGNSFKAYNPKVDEDSAHVFEHKDKDTFLSVLNEVTLRSKRYRLLA